MNPFPYTNSLVKKSRRELFFPLMSSVSNPNTNRIVCHLVKICFETIFWSSFYKISFANLQSILKRTFLLYKSSWNFEMQISMDKISFLIVEQFLWESDQIPEWNLTNCLWDDSIFYFNILPYLNSDASVLTIINTQGCGIPKHHNDF